MLWLGHRFLLVQVHGILSYFTRRSLPLLFFLLFRYYWLKLTLMGASPNTFQIRRFASQTKLIQEFHPERSAGSRSGERSCAALRMTKRDALFFEMYWGQAPQARTEAFHGRLPHPTLGI